MPNSQDLAIRITAQNDSASAFRQLKNDLAEVKGSLQNVSSLTSSALSVASGSFGGLAAALGFSQIYDALATSKKS